MKLTLLGTGSPLPSLLRASTGHFVEAGGVRLVIDVGPGTVHRLMECGAQPAGVTHILLSHLHFDHIGDLARLLFCSWDRNGGISALPTIMGPPGTRLLVDRLFGPDGAFAADLTARTSHKRSLQIYEDRGGILPRPWPSFEVQEISGTGRLNLLGMQILHAPVLHHQPYLDSLGFRVEADGGVATYSSDIAITQEASYADSLRELAEDADVLVHYLNAFDFDGQNMAQSKPALMGRMAEDLGVRLLVTTHHGPAMDKPGVRENTLKAIATTFSGQLFWGEDRLSFSICGGAAPALEAL